MTVPASLRTAHRPPATAAAQCSVSHARRPVRRHRASPHPGAALCHVTPASVARNLFTVAAAYVTFNALKPSRSPASPAPPVRQLPSTAPIDALDDVALQARFERATEHVKSLRRLRRKTKLEVYSLYRQALNGDCDRRAKTTGIRERMMADAWCKVRGMSSRDAMAKYVVRVERLARDEHNECP